jgi:hypothetical protein
MTQILSKHVRASLRAFNRSQTSAPLPRPYHPSAMLPLVSREMYEADRKRAASSKSECIPTKTTTANRWPVHFPIKERRGG